MPQVPPGHVWLQGDNLIHSLDSRQYGPVPMGMVRGKVFMQYGPAITWQYGPAITWQYSPAITWQYGPAITWQYSPVPMGMVRGKVFMQAPDCAGAIAAASGR
eukprot:gene3557-13629_t